jgi:protease-4
VIDDAYEQFFSVVVEGRKLQPEKVRELCQGQVFTGHQAKELGLVDELGDMKEAIKVAGRLAGIKGQPKVIDIDRPMKNLFDFMLNAAPSEMLKSIIQDKSGVRLEYMLR